ncbi:Uncharacterized HTH-type transcriptional regulator YcaN [Durusdinium trenchii]|uniref:Probable RuBisCO transcriptional regulator n=1 Tax=Durusdinium trenchii TaxID=1381693 RepID=A0ABP0LJU5_9DINO
MAVFVEVARAKGFRAAAEKLKLGAGSVSEAVQRFEDRLGVRLFERSTRSIALTPAGERLYERSLPAIRDLESAVQELNDSKDVVAGTLRLSAPRSAGPFFLTDLLARFATAHPEVDVELIYDDRKVNLVTAGVDAAIRSQTLVEQDTYALPVGPELKLALVASPDYLERAGVPATPHDLIAHDGLFYAFDQADRLALWAFAGPGGGYSVTPRSRMVVNDLSTLLSLTEAGLGIAYLYEEPAKTLISKGRLISLFKDEIPALPRYTLNYLTKRHMPARLRAFIDFSK